MADGVSVVIERITKGGAAFLQALQQHATLKPAAEAALNADAAFDLPKFLLESVQSGVIVDFAA
jgi:hypothetical protein